MNPSRPMKRSSLVEGLVAAGAGFVFAVGLAISGMTQPAKVIGFLDVTGAWDGSLVFVMGGAVLVSFVLFRLIVRRPSPAHGPRFHLPTKRDIDSPLVLGAALFGIGWGLAGYCPGPAVASLAFGNAEALAFVVAMLVGMGAFELFARPSAVRAHSS
jgi:uncharacterized membrane protein YedE/YeeE